ncbi:MAG: hypothetical protein MnENMB40S_29000 [Rhizobiaceae bacterium MnEN-MB40S]|nr:MAG: hypothetical protein MnENMB40S_29000 [Rhizobiaceae bacterium MnEN-MB40S]
MTRLVNHSEMTPEEIIDCSHMAMAIVEICAGVADNIDDLRGKQSIDHIGGNLSMVLKSAYRFMEPVHDALETVQARQRRATIKAA